MEGTDQEVPASPVVSDRTVPTTAMAGITVVATVATVVDTVVQRHRSLVGSGRRGAWLGVAAGATVGLVVARPSKRAIA